jgi:hypothetical protein
MRSVGSSPRSTVDAPILFLAVVGHSRLLADKLTSFFAVHDPIAVPQSATAHMMVARPTNRRSTKKSWVMQAELQQAKTSYL